MKVHKVAVEDILSVLFQLKELNVTHVDVQIDEDKNTLFFYSYAKEKQDTNQIIDDI
jgi:cell fate regulator YaaT (PSP1 superfamily)